MERIVELDDRPRPDQAHHEVPEHEAGQQHVDDMDEAVDRFARALAVEFLDEQRHEANHGVDQCKPAEDARADRQSRTEADDQDGPRRGLRIFLRETHEPYHQDHHRDREWRILGVHEHVPVEGRAEREQQ